MKKVNLLLLILVTLCISCSPKQNSSALDLNVMSFNIRYDNEEDSLNNWQYRKDRVCNAIKFYQVDVLGTQEVLHNQLADMQSRLPDYSVIGVGREDGKEKGEYSALWYNNKKFQEVESGYFWLSETPDVAGSRGWDGACERIATWAILKDIKSEKEFFVLNTHLDHVGKVARKESVQLILRKLHDLSKGLPFIMTGDFNSLPDTEVIKDILADNLDKIVDSRSVSPIVYGPSWSFHDFGKLSYNDRELIDYIFVSGNLEVTRWGVLAETDNEEFLSDHAPILSTVVLK